MSIKTTLENVQSFSTLDGLVKRVNVHLSFWGSRYITVPGYEGSLDIGAIADQAEKIEKACNRLTIRQYWKALDVVFIIDDIYEISLRQERDAYFFTKILGVFREFIKYGLFAPDDTWRNYFKEDFTYHLDKKLKLFWFF